MSIQAFVFNDKISFYAGIQVANLISEVSGTYWGDALRQMEWPAEMRADGSGVIKGN
jgi:hypothetical protein